MKNSIILFLILVSFSSFSQKTNDRKASYNIKDYFLLLPDSIFKDVEIPLSLEQRQIALKYKTLEQIWNHKGYWKIDTIDYKNGFMKISTTGDGGGSMVEITYFIKKDKSRLIAVNISQWDIMGISSNVKFYTYKNKIWKDVTTDVLPKVKISDFTINEFVKYFDLNENNPLFYNLPQKGKNIIVRIDNGAVEKLFDSGKINDSLYKKINSSLKERVLYWHDGKFSFQK